MNFLEENNKRARKRQRTDSIEKLKTYENKVVIEIKLPDEIKTSLSHDWHLINSEHKVKFLIYQLKNKKIYLFFISVVNYSLSTNCRRNYESLSSIKIQQTKIY